MSHRVRVFKHLGQWHWWCADCMGGDWDPTWTYAIILANRHVRDHASTVKQVRRGVEYMINRYRTSA